MARVREKWDALDEDIKAHYIAIMQRIAHDAELLAPAAPFCKEMDAAELQNTGPSELSSAPIGISTKAEQPAFSDDCRQQEDVRPTSEKQADATNAAEQAVEQLRLAQEEGQPLEGTESLELAARGTLEDRVLVRLKVARRALARAKTIQQAKHISDIAEAIRTYTERSGMAKEAQDDAASFAIEAEYRVSKLYKAAKDQGLLATGSRGQLKGRKSSGGVVVTPPEKQPTLAEVDIGKELAKRLRKLAPLSEEELVKRIEQKRAAHELTKTAVLGEPVKKRVRTPTRQDCLKTLFKFIEVLANSADEPYDDVFLSGQKLDIGKYHAARPKFIKFINCVDTFIKAQPAAASPTGEERKPQESV